jgi:hypothetical protein
MAVTSHPPHRPVLAALSHRVLTSDVPPHGCWREIAHLETYEQHGERVAIDQMSFPAFPRWAAFGCAVPPHEPVAGDLWSKARQHCQVARDCMVLVVAVEYAPQPSANLRCRFVHLSAKSLLNFLQFLPPSVAIANAPDFESPQTVLRTYTLTRRILEAQKGERLRFRSSIPGPSMPLSTLHPAPHRAQRKTRGQDGSLLLILWAL